MQQADAQHPMMTRLAATGERNRAAPTASANTEHGRHGGVDPGLEADEHPAGMTAAATAGRPWRRPAAR